jgi:predicted PurR-regulated permease PerM
MLKKLIPLIFSSVFFEKLLAFGFLIFLGYLLSDFLILFFITFLFAYLFLEAGSWLVGMIHAWWLHTRRNRASELALRYNNTNIVVTILYILFIAVLIFLFVTIIPQIIREMWQFVNGAPRIASQIQNFANDLENTLQMNLWLNEIVGDIINSQNLEIIGQTMLGYLKNTGIILTKFIIGLILSYIFVMERKQIIGFLSQIKQGNFLFFYEEYALLSQKITGGFGAIIRAQSLIAMTNAVLTSIGLLLISFIHGGNVFPYIFTLSLIVLVFWFIPVFGTFISGVPILIIAYGYGWTISVLLCTLMIAVVHAIEAYYLNPRIVSSYVHIPVFVTFIILLLSEHFFGLIGLLIGVPLFIITLGFIEDLDRYINSIKKKLNDA